MIEQRNQLRARLKAYEILLPIYIPGLIQYRADLATSLPAFEHPEDAPLWLPSSIYQNRRRQICTPDLPLMEEKLRNAQCYDALNSIRHILKLKSRMVAFKNQNVRGQNESTRSQTIIKRVHTRAHAAADKYRTARKAKLALSGPGDWEKELRVLEDADVRAYQDPTRLQLRPGRRGTLDDEQIEQQLSGGDTVHFEGDSPSFTLFNEERSRRDGTGETRRALSWIWLNNKGGGMDDSADDILRAEWAKSRARAARATEEVQLLREEMRRVLSFLDWKSKWWRSQAALRKVQPGLREGLEAYALVQANLQDLLASDFRATWRKPLEDEPASVERSEDNEDDSDDDSDDEDDVAPLDDSSDGEDY